MILVADSDASTASVLQYSRLLKRYAIRWVSSPGEALRVARNLRPAIAIVAMQLRSGSGADLIPLLHEGWPGLPIVCTSSRPDPEVEKLAYRLGVTAYFVKPVDRHLLCRTVLSIDDYRIRLQRRRAV